MVIQPKIKILERGSSQGSMKLNHLKLKQGQNSFALNTGFDAITKYLVISRTLVVATRLERVSFCIEWQH